MSLIGKVGRRRMRTRISLGVLYLVLGLGAVVTAMPFLLMAAEGMTGPTDQSADTLVPRYVYVRSELFAKFVSDKYAGNGDLVASTRTGPQAPPHLLKIYQEFLLDLPEDDWLAGFQLAPDQVTGKLANRYESWLRKRFPNISALNRAYREEATDFGAVETPIEMLDVPNWTPPASFKYRDWLRFKASLPAEYRIPITTKWLFQQWAREHFANQIKAIPASLRGDARGFDDLTPPKTGPWLKRFIASGIPKRLLRQNADKLWAERLKSLDIAWSPMPIEAQEAAFVRHHAAALRLEFATRNYRYAIGYIVSNGRSLWVTLILCGLTVLGQLIVNPLAAYALSRYPIRSSGKILLFLLATMAFPTEVAMIPAFLLVRDLHLLNTYAALVLPSIANGFMIYLLKGFFDSLPQEFFEAAMIDGAPERVMMMRIAWPLSKPILGYLSLLAFLGAYGSFLYAFLVAQDRSMWTIMVWLYQLQQVSPSSVAMAAMTVAAVPTLIVFLLAQRVLVRGIVLPEER